MRDLSLPPLDPEAIAEIEKAARIVCAVQRRAGRLADFGCECLLLRRRWGALLSAAGREPGAPPAPVVPSVA